MYAWALFQIVEERRLACPGEARKTSTAFYGLPRAAELATCFLPFGMLKMPSDN